MNERILKLFTQACYHGDYEPENVPNAVVEKFAELIVRECADLTRWQEYDMSVEQRIRLGIYQEIKQHFGVEE
jgi:hypothetical protein